MEGEGKKTLIKNLTEIHIRHPVPVDINKNSQYNIWSSMKCIGSEDMSKTSLKPNQRRITDTVLLQKLFNAVRLQ